MLTGTVSILLFTSAPALAAAAPQAEGSGIYLASLPLLLTAAYLLCPRLTLLQAGLALLVTLPGFLMVGFIAWGFFFLPCLAILQGVENHKRFRLAHRHAANPERYRAPRTAPVPWTRFATGTALLVLCGACWGLTVWSTSYTVIAQRHEDAVESLRVTAQNIQDYQKQKHALPSPEAARPLLPRSLPFTYEVQPEHGTFRVFYAGNAFTQNPWYTLGPALPEYRSDSGLVPGTRQSFFRALASRVTRGR